MAKKKNRISFMLIILLLIIMGALAVVFDVGGIKDLLLPYIIKDTQGQSLDQSRNGTMIAEEMEFIKAEKAKMAALRLDLEDYRTQLINKEKELDEREALLQEKDLEVQELEARLTKEFRDITGLVAIYDKMDSEEAAAILAQVEDVQQVILIIKTLKKEKSAEILGLMDTKKAADILSNLNLEQ